MPGKMIGELNGKGMGKRVHPSYGDMLNTGNSFQQYNKLPEVDVRDIATYWLFLNRGDTKCIKHRHYNDRKWLDCN